MTDTAAYGEEGISDDYDGEQDETEDDEIHETDLAALLGNSGEDPETDDALAEALPLDAVAMVAWQRFNDKGKGKSKGKGKVKGKGKGKSKGNKSLEERKKRLAELKSRTNCQAWRVAPCTPRSDIPVETPPKTPPSPHRLHRHLSASGGCKEYSRRGTNATVERFTCGLRIRHHMEQRERRKTQPCVLMLKLTRGAVPRLWCDTFAKRA